jgi:hypothetical protein
VYLKRLLCDEDLQLIELPQKSPFELSDEAAAAPRAKIQGGHDDDLVKVKSRTALPNALQREFPPPRGQAPKTGEQTALQDLKVSSAMGRPSL